MPLLFIIHGYKYKDNIETDSIYKDIPILQE